MSAQVRTPTARSCERCGRSERWDPDSEAWQIVREEGNRQAGNPHCIHEWDINGAFNPVTGTVNGK